MTKAKSILIRAGRDPRQTLLMDICVWLAENRDYGNASNALLALARQSPLYREAFEAMPQNLPRNGRKSKAGPR